VAFIRCCCFFRFPLRFSPFPSSFVCCILSSAPVSYRLPASTRNHIVSLYNKCIKIYVGRVVRECSREPRCFHRGPIKTVLCVLYIPRARYPALCSNTFCSSLALFLSHFLSVSVSPSLALSLFLALSTMCVLRRRYR